MTDKDFFLETTLAGSDSEIVAAVDAAPSEQRQRLLQAIEQRLARSIQGLDEKHREQVARLAGILSVVQTDDRIESRIKVLSEACFYFNRIGRAFDGIAIGVLATKLAKDRGLVNLERFAGTALGLAYSDSACFEEACQTLERTLVLARSLDDPELECLAVTNTAALLKDMGLYQDAMEVTDMALAFGLDTPRGRVLALNNASHGLFSAHRMRDDEAALRYLRIGSDVLEDNPLADVVHKAAFEYFRAMYLLSTDDHETAEVLIEAARKRVVDVRNLRVHVLLGIAGALCDWASRDPAREVDARRQLLDLYATTKRTHLHHDNVLRALIDVHKRTITGETNALERKNAKNPDDADEGLDALTRIVTQTAKTGIGYAKELVQYNSGPNPMVDPSRESTEYVAGVKNAKFYRQMSDRAAAAAAAGNPPRKRFDPFAGAHAWLADVGDPLAFEDLFESFEPDDARSKAPKVVRKHDELAAIHSDMAQLRIESLKAALRTAAYDVAENWALAAEFFDDQTGEHCFRVGRLAGLLATELGIDAENCVRIEHAARLHDIGKIAVNELILLKPGPLDSNEIVAMRAHTEVGAQLLENSSDPTLQMAASIAKYHHAWWNGAGYPATHGENIPLAARICAYADVYDALTNERPYKRAWPHRMAVEQMLSESGTHLDPSLMTPFLKVLERHIGSNAHIPSTRQHLYDMEENGLLVSRRKLMLTLQAI